MEQTERHRRAETLRLIEWISNNRIVWRSICLSLTEEEVLIPEQCGEVIRILRNNGFYQLLVVLAYSNNQCVRDAIEFTILSELRKNWDDDLFNKTLDALLDNIAKL